MASKGIPRDRLETFVEVYMKTTNASEAARAAGYKGSPKVVSESARKLLRRKDVLEMIETARLVRKATNIATREERQQFWSSVMRGEDIETVNPVTGQPMQGPPPMAARMKASELLGKSEGDFIKRVEVNHGGQVVLVKAEIPDNGRSRVTPPDAERALASPSTSPTSSDG